MIRTVKLSCILPLLPCGVAWGHGSATVDAGSNPDHNRSYQEASTAAADHKLIVIAESEIIPE